METEALAFTPRKQDALLGHLLNNDRLFSQCKNSIEPGWFSDPYNQKIWKAKIGLSQEWNRVPTIHELRDCKAFMKESQRDRQLIAARIAKVLASINDYGSDILMSELTDWMKTQRFKKGVLEASEYYNKSDIQKAVKTVSQMSKDIQLISFDNHREVIWDDYINLFSKQLEQRHHACTIGLTPMDKLIDPQCLSGSLLSGDRTTILAPTNIGKTTFMITAAMANVKRGKDVLFISHEGKEEDLQEKIWMNAMGARKSVLYELFKKHDQVKEIFQQILKVLNNHLVYIPYSKPRLSVEEVEDLIYQTNDRWKAKHGKGFDLIVNDYPAKLGTKTNSSGKLSTREKDDYVYEVFTQIALDLKCHVLDAIQTNRDGSRVNKGQKGAEKRLLTMEDVKETWGAMTSATNVITLNRSLSHISKQIFIAHLCKSRSNEVGWSVICRSDFGAATTHSDQLGCTWYKGSGLMSETIDTLLEQYAGTVIPSYAIGL